MATTPGWIRQFHKPRAALAPLVICPHAGGGASTYRSFSKHLRDHFDVVVLQYPGRQDRAREAALSTLPCSAIASTARKWRRRRAFVPPRSAMAIYIYHFGYR